MRGGRLLVGILGGLMRLLGVVDSRRAVMVSVDGYRRGRMAIQMRSLVVRGGRRAARSVESSREGHVYQVVILKGG